MVSCSLGLLRGGIVKSGIIRGGTIDKGVIVQDAEIGPGVEIHDGIVKGGKITINNLIPVPGTQEAMFNNPSVTEVYHTDENRSNIMYSIEVLPKPTEDGSKPSPVAKDLSNKTDTSAKHETQVDHVDHVDDVDHKKAPQEKKIAKKKKKDKTFLEKSLKSMGEVEAHIAIPKSPNLKHSVRNHPNNMFPTPRITKPSPKITSLKLSAYKPGPAVKGMSYPLPKQKGRGTHNTAEARHKVNVNDISEIRKLLQTLEASSNQSVHKKRQGESKRRDEADSQVYAVAAKRENDDGRSSVPYIN